MTWKSLLIFESVYVSCSDVVIVAGCDKKSNDNGNTGDGGGQTVDPAPDETVDYVAQTKLTQAVTETSSFFGDDGIAYATVERCVDGDTAVFLTGGVSFTARFLGVDTPESTGDVEEWGKTASLFTAAKLNNAYNLTQKAYDVSVNRFAAGQTSAIELSDVSGALYQMDMALLNAKYNILMAGESVKKLGE